MSLVAASLSCKDTDDEHASLSGSFHEITKHSFCTGDKIKNELNSSVLSQQQKDISKTIALDRTNDNVYMATTKVVKAIMSLTHGVEKAAAIQYLELVRYVGIELRTLLSSVDELASIFPSHALKYVVFFPCFLFKIVMIS